VSACASVLNCLGLNTQDEDSKGVTKTETVIIKIKTLNIVSGDETVSQDCHRWLQSPDHVSGMTKTETVIIEIKTLNIVSGDETVSQDCHR